MSSRRIVYLTALAMGAVSGFAATGMDQSVKQLRP